MDSLGCLGSNKDAVVVQVQTVGNSVIKSLTRAKQSLSYNLESVSDDKSVGQVGAR